MGDVSSEPTMEEILSSIKRVIEESEAAPTAARPRKTVRTSEPRDPPPTDEILELSERAPFPVAEHLPPQAAKVETPVAPPEPRLESRAEAYSQSRAESILSPDAAEASRGPLEALSRLIVRPDAPADNTLEGLVRDMLRPMLREWLDAQLPGIVEAMVAKEIARISGRGL